MSGKYEKGREDPYEKNGPEQKEESVGKVFLRYVRQYRAATLMFFAFSGIFSLVFSLYRLETEAVLYASALCMLVSAAALTVSFLFYLKKHRVRQTIYKEPLLLLEELPEPETLAEEDLRKILWKVKKILEEERTAWEKESQESMEYYTAWVHQIKTPIAVMRMILAEEDTGKNRTLAIELFRIEQYVEMVLCYLRLGSESSDYIFEECELDGIIRQAVRKYAPQFVQKKLKLEYEPVEWKVLTDEKWFLFIVEQILSNAVKYTQQGAVTITVTKDRMLQIADTGIGIAAGDLPRIFEKGFTGYNGRSDKKSTGLGLYLAKLAADRLSHRITVESVEGKGTSFFIDLNRYEFTPE